MRLPSLLLSAVVLASLSLSLGSAGCSIHLGENTQGDKGTTSFKYEGPGCLLGCSLEQNALQGSLVTVTARGGDPTVAQTARISESSIARVSAQTPSCTCESSGGSSTSVAPGEQCKPGAVRSCSSLSVDIETSGEGDAHLEILGPGGALIDRVTVHVRPAARLDVSVGETAVKDDTPVTVRVGDTVALETRAFDADGNKEIFTQHGISHDYGDKSILEPADDLLASTNVESMIARQPGDATVTVRAPGAERVVRFHVVAP